MRRLLFCLTASIFVISACTKDETPINGPDPVAKSVLGKWAVKDIAGLEATLMSGGLKSSPFSDTLIYTADMRYCIINNGDTADRGEFTIGHGQAINGFGTMQQYNSLVYNSSSLTDNAPFSPIVYFKMKEDTLSFSTGYFKDSATTKLYASYIRQ